jgi:hypothetical protein
MSVRQRKDILDRLIKDFTDYSLPAMITYSGYIKLVTDPVLPRAIRKTYGNWTRAVKAVQIAKPELFAPKAASAPKPAVELAVEVKEVKAVVKPAPKPVKKPTVMAGK